MFEVDVKNVMEEGREGKGRTRLGFLLGYLSQYNTVLITIQCNTYFSHYSTILITIQ